MSNICLYLIWFSNRVYIRLCKVGVSSSTTYLSSLSLPHVWMTAYDILISSHICVDLIPSSPTNLSPPLTYSTLAAIGTPQLEPRVYARGEGGPCPVARDCTRVATTNFEGFPDLDSTLVLNDRVSSASTSTSTSSFPASEPRHAVSLCLWDQDCRRLGTQAHVRPTIWGGGRYPRAPNILPWSEVEDVACVLPTFFHVSLWMLADNTPIDNLDRVSFRFPMSQTDISVWPRRSSW